jgi:flagellar biogenesis protein FliO
MDASMLASVSVLADSARTMAPGAASGAGATWQLLRMLLALGAVCVVLVVSKRVLAGRLAPARLRGARKLGIVDQIVLGRGKSLCVVRASGRDYLIGVTETNIRLLSALDAAAIGEGSTQSEERS